MTAGRATQSTIGWLAMVVGLPIIFAVCYVIVVVASFPLIEEWTRRPPDEHKEPWI